MPRLVHRYTEVCGRKAELSFSGAALGETGREGAEKEERRGQTDKIFNIGYVLIQNLFLKMSKNLKTN